MMCGWNHPNFLDVAGLHAISLIITTPSTSRCLWKGLLWLGKLPTARPVVESSWNVMAHGDARVGKWRENWRMEWVASTLHTPQKLGVSSITAADAHTSSASSRLNWRPCRFKWTCLFRRKTKSGFWACVITFQTQSTTHVNQNKQLLFLCKEKRSVCT